MRRIGLICVTFAGIAAGIASAEDLPSVPDGFNVSVFAQEPLVRNPCAMTFDRRGRLFASQGVQYRQPEPDTPGDRVTLLLDEDRDGRADRTHTFAEGFNHIQGLMWRGGRLWVANAPDLTVVEDLDGDDVADRYTVLYGGLGNLEHALHGLNSAPDGRVYMSKGNSKGYGKTDSPEHRVAPKAFFDLWGMQPPADIPAMPSPEVYTPRNYRRGFHHPSDDWGAEGGILRCDPDGSNLEVQSRGMRNPWDMAFDAEFNWLTTDQDQDGGDRILAPFTGAHFGWGHAWSPHWTGEGHLPTVPISGPTFHGSGTGVVYCASSRFPERYRNVFLFNDWLKRRTLVYRPQWDGALMRNMNEPEVFAAAPKGRAMGSSSGVLYDVVDMEVGPDGALWVLSWGHGYGATIRNGQQVDRGRVYRIGYGEHPHYRPESHRGAPIVEWTLEQLIADLRHEALPVWRIDAADELVRRGAAAKSALMETLRRDDLPAGASTWLAWTLGRMDVKDRSIDTWLESHVKHGATADCVQALRILGDRARRGAPMHDVVIASLRADEPRVRFAAVQAIRESRHATAAERLWAMAATERDRATFYAVWRTLGTMVDAAALREKLSDDRDGVRRAALLALLERGALSGDEAAAMRLDGDRAVAELASSFVKKVGTSAESVLDIEPAESQFDDTLEVRIVARAKGLHVRYTVDGTEPTDTAGKSYTRPFTLDGDATVRAALFDKRVRVGPVVERRYERRGKVVSVNDAVMVRAMQARSGGAYRLMPAGLRPGVKVYTNRDYRWTQVPPELIGATIIQCSNDDADVGSRGERFLSFHLDEAADVYVAHDRRIDAKPDWLKAFEKTDLKLSSRDATYDLYRRRFDPGEVALGGSTTDGQAGGRSQYAVAILPAPIVLTPRTVATTVDDVIRVMDNGDAKRGRRLFFGAAACGSCHRVGDRGNAFAPDLSDLKERGDTRALAEAILDPNATITEGYQGLAVTKEDGQAYFGFIRRESGLSLEIVQADGTPVSIPKADIASRRRVDTSVMPASFQHTLSPTQVADLIVFLTSSQTSGIATQQAAVVQPAAGKAWGHAQRGFHLVMHDDAMDIQFDGRSIASFVFRDKNIWRPYFAHVRTLGGIQVTRNHPPVKGQDPTDHPTMHPGVWLGFADLDGVSFWHNRKGRVTHEGFVREPRVDGDTASYVTHNRYVVDDDTVCRQITRYTLSRDPVGYRISIDAQFVSDREFYFGVKEEMGLGVRVASPIRVRDGNGSIVSASGGRNEAGTWGRHDHWWDYAGTIDGRLVGVTIFAAPDNPKVWAHSRDYGVLVANPFPVDVEKNRQTRTIVKPGETFRLRFGVLVHESARQDAYDPASAYRRYVESQR